jgi:mono/diheme cytochrome c family protein
MRRSQLVDAVVRTMQTILAAAVLAGPLSMLYGQTKPVIKHVPTEYTVASDGPQMFKTYCAVCHGTDGKGGGAAAPALKKAPTDLTLLSRTNQGKFPELRVIEAIRGDLDVAAHGSKDMPVWGRVFRRMHDDESVARLRLYAVTKYIESMQAK